MSPVSAYAVANEGIKTGDNDRFLRFWFEVAVSLTNINSSDPSSAKWQATAKAGESRKWFGSHYVVTNFENCGAEMLATGHASITAKSNLYRHAITWNRIGSGRLSFRYLPNGFISNMGGLCLYTLPGKDNCLLSLLALLNSSVAQLELAMLNPSTSFPPGTINSIGCGCFSPDTNCDLLVDECISMAKSDWDSFETSWDFKRHPLL